MQRFRFVARVAPHTPAIQLRGDCRYLEGRAPDQSDEGLNDCRIYEAVLEIARAHLQTSELKYYVSRDGGFDAPELAAELGSLGFELRRDPGRLYGELK